ncbi:MAG: hypothetical protein KAT05_02235, partial [Spirochaetes bacterium]|nr:hypothetical protein [Spirochaetota bacterium]
KESDDLNPDLSTDKKNNLVAPKKITKKTIFEKIEVEEPKDFTSKHSKKHIASIFLILIGIENAARVIKHFKEVELISVMNEILKISTISKEEVLEVEKIFGKVNINDLSQCKGGRSYTRKLLQKTFDIDKGSKLFIKCLKAYSEKEDPLYFMNHLSAKAMFEIIADESDMVNSVILGLLDPKKAAEILRIFPRQRSINLIKRLSKRLEIRPQVLNTIIQKIQQKVSANIQDDGFKIHGKQKLVEILKHSQFEKSSLIISNLEKIAPKLADEIKEKIFTFNDIARIPRKSLAIALKKYDNKDIAFLLKGASDEMRAFFFRCVTKKRKNIIIEEIDYLGKVKKSDVDIKRKDFINYVKQLEEDGKIILSPDNEIYVE